MTTQTNNIETLTLTVKSAMSQTHEGRQTIANSCKELYNLIEEDTYKAGKEWMLKGMYNDLCNGNFAEPFMCEQKKNTFMTIVEVYNTDIVPNI